MPLVPGPPVIVTKTPFRSLAAFLRAKVTSQVGPPAEKWSRGTASVMQVKALSGHGLVPTSCHGGALGLGATACEGAAVGAAGLAAGVALATIDGPGLAGANVHGPAVVVLPHAATSSSVHAVATIRPSGRTRRHGAVATARIAAW